MSADNWRKCPACRAKAERERQKRIDAADLAYGKVPAEQWQKMKTEAEKPIMLEDNFREDYEFCLGTSKGGPFEFFVSYRGQCQDCGFGKDYEHREMLTEKCRPLN